MSSYCFDEHQAEHLRQTQMCFTTASVAAVLTNSNVFQTVCQAAGCCCLAVVRVCSTPQLATPVLMLPMLRRLSLAHAQLKQLGTRQPHAQTPRM